MAYKVSFPVCLMCGASNPYPCKVCGVQACPECTLILTPDMCVHKKFEPIPSEGGWKEPIRG